MVTKSMIKGTGYILEYAFESIDISIYLYCRYDNSMLIILHMQLNNFMLYVLKAIYYQTSL